jgi:hypothetical protein
LQSLDAQADAATETVVLKAVGNALQTARGNLKTNEEKQRQESRLDLLKKMLALIQPETPETKAARRMEVEARKKEIDDIESKLAALNPFTEPTSVPPGPYRIFAKDGEAKIPLVDIQILTRKP